MAYPNKSLWESCIRELETIAAVEFVAPKKFEPALGSPVLKHV
jgi:hypothetical protein